MLILKKLCQAVFRQHSRKRVMSGKRIIRKPVRRHTRKTPLSIPVTVPRQRSVSRIITNKQSVKTCPTRPNDLAGQATPFERAQTPFKAMINLASIFADKSAGCIRLTKIPLPSKENGKLRIQATNLETWFTGTIKYEDTDNKNPMGQVCVDARVIKKVITGMNGTTNIKLFKDRIDINDYSVPVSCNVKDFPSIPEPTDMRTTRKRTYNITDLGQKLAFLARALAKADAYSRDQVVICFDVKRGKLVTTDGHRMHITPTGREGHNPGYTGSDVMVAPKILKVAKVLSGTFRLLQNHRIVFGLDVPDCQAEVGSILCEGQYPRYTEIIPREFCGKCVFTDKQELLYNLKRAIAAYTDEYKLTRFTFSKNKRPRISVSHNDDTILFKENIDNAEYQGDLFVGGINAEYLFDAIRNMPDDRIEISLPKSRNSAWIVKGPSSKYMAVIMPINTREEDIN